VLGRLGRHVVWAIDCFLLSGVKLLHSSGGRYLMYYFSICAVLT
jgi:hypothetical protein